MLSTIQSQDLVQPTNTVKHLSPLCPHDAPVTGKGLERERFEALLRASRERNAIVGAKKAVDLRKEIALKAHRNKQVERRALFLSKVQAPPSPTATSTPKTPPDSPAIFHYSLPSPGLVSPLALFDTIYENKYAKSYTCQPWVEQVDFRLANESKKHSSRSAALPQTNKLPSLDQISERLKTLASARTTTFTDEYRHPAAPAPPTKPATIEIGRLKLPVRALKSSPEPVSLPPSILRRQTPINMPPVQPKSPNRPRSDLQVTTTVVPRTAPIAPAQLTESNLKQLNANAREHRAHNMMSTLRKRTLSTPGQAQFQTQPQSAPIIPILNTAKMPGTLTRNAARRTTLLPLSEETMSLGFDDRKLKWKRHSAPADLMQQRIGFEHPVMALPGAF